MVLKADQNFAFFEVLESEISPATPTNSAMSGTGVLSSAFEFPARGSESGHVRSKSLFNFHPWDTGKNWTRKTSAQSQPPSPSTPRTPSGNSNNGRPWTLKYHFREKWMRKIASKRFPAEYTKAPHSLLEQLDLDKEVNHVTFGIEGQTIHGRVFVWSPETKIVVSDIDGTITKTDIRGQIATKWLGKQYAHAGVAELYQSIQSRGYKILYMTVRSIASCAFTIKYLESVKQGMSSLPQGPLIMPAVKGCTIIRWQMPEEYKINMLCSIKELFPENPFVAGWGNRDTDVISYNAVGIPPEKCFKVNTKGKVVCHEQRHKSFTSICEKLEELNLFPYLNGAQVFEHEVADVNDPHEMKHLSTSIQ
jgi:phosphatidate phosphatase LPIN